MTEEWTDRMIDECMETIHIKISDRKKIVYFGKPGVYCENMDINESVSSKRYKLAYAPIKTHISLHVRTV